MVPVDKMVKKVRFVFVPFLFLLDFVLPNKVSNRYIIKGEVA